MKGKQAEIPRGFHVAAFVDGDRMIAARFTGEIPAVSPGTISTPVSSMPVTVQAALHPAASPARPNLAEFGEINITSTPVGAEVEIDGAYYGNTPGLIRLVPGSHTITIRSAGHEIWKRTLNIGPGSSLTVKADLAKIGLQAARNK